MAHQLDPEGNEIAALKDAVELNGRRVVEIGCGDGRMMMRYADRLGLLVGIDPDHENCRNVWRNTPANQRDRVEVVGADAVHLPLRSATFDVAIFGCSL